MSAANAAPGVNVTDVPSAATVACPATPASVSTTVDGWTGSLNVALTVVLVLTPVAPAVGVRLVAGSDGADHTSLAQAHLDASGAATYDFDITWQVPPLPGLTSLGSLVSLRASFGSREGWLP